METLWFALAAVDGRDLRRDGRLRLRRRRAPPAASRAPIASAARCCAAIGPFWDGNEVWLLAAGGVLFLAFPGCPRGRALGLLPRDLPRAVDAHPARHRDRVPLARRGPALALLLGRHLRRRVDARAGAVRRRARQPPARRAALRGGLVRAAALRVVLAHRRARHPRLVHGARRHLRAGRDPPPRRALPRLAHRRRGARAQSRRRGAALPGDRRALAARDRRHRPHRAADGSRTSPPGRSPGSPPLLFLAGLVGELARAARPAATSPPSSVRAPSCSASSPRPRRRSTRR